MPSLFDYLGYAGNALDLPASSLRDLLTGNNPFDQWATPFSDRNRATGRDVLRPFLGVNEETGIAGWADNPMEGLKDIAGFGAEVLLDPLNFVSGAGVVKALRGAKAAKGRNAVAAAENAAKAGKYGYVNPKAVSRVRNPITTNWQDDVARMETERLNLVGQADNEGFGTASIFQDIFGETEDSLAALDKAGLRQRYDELGNRIDEIRSQNPMKLLGYTPEPERLFHGGRDWAPSATPEKPYGMFDVRRIKSGEGGQAYGPGMYASDSPQVSQHYKELVQDRLDNEAALSIFDMDNHIADMNDALVVASDGYSKGFDPDSVKALLSSSSNPQAMPLFDTLRANNFFGFDMSDPDAVTELLSNLGSEKSLRSYFDEDVANVLRPFALAEESGYAKLYELDVPAGTKGRFMRWEDDVSDQPINVQALVNPMMEPDLFGDIPAGTGDQLFEMVTGTYPARAGLNQAIPLSQAGVPGMSNPAAITRGARNYAIWDTNLIDQMRVRGIDGQRVPINPTTLVQQLRQQVPRAADSPLTSTTNPMRQMERVPSVLNPAVGMMLQNATARYHGPGGIQ